MRPTRREIKDREEFERVLDELRTRALEQLQAGVCVRLIRPQSTPASLRTAANVSSISHSPDRRVSRAQSKGRPPAI